MKHVSVQAISHDRELVRHTEELKDKLYRLLHELDGMGGSCGEALGALPTAQRVRAILRVRRARSQIFGSDLFADPAWDMLLELYLAELAHCRLSVSSLCTGAAVPATTALRWMKVLETRGMIRRTADPTDGRRVFVALSDEARRAMDSLFSAIPATELLL